MGIWMTSWLAVGLPDFREHTPASQAWVSVCGWLSRVAGVVSVCQFGLLGSE